MSNLFPSTKASKWTADPPNIHIIGNLPFNVSTPLIVQWLNSISQRSDAWKYGRVRMTLTFQKEVAERMIAPILNDQRCRLSVMCQYLCDVRHVFTIPGRLFVPEPDVDVGVVHFTPHVQPKINAPFEYVEKLLRHVFHYRQKKCKHGLT
jgi:dimethyladenosine transferase 1